MYETTTNTKQEDTTMKSMEYRVFRNGEPQNPVIEPYCGEFRSAFSHMFPSFKTISASETHIEAHCVMDGNYFEIVASDINA